MRRLWEERGKVEIGCAQESEVVQRRAERERVRVLRARLRQRRHDKEQRNPAGEAIGKDSTVVIVVGVEENRLYIWCRRLVTDYFAPSTRGAIASLRPAAARNLRRHVKRRRDEKERMSVVG